MEGQSIGTHPEITLLHCGFQQGLHALQLGLCGGATDAGLKPHNLNPQHRMGHKRRHIGPKWQRFEVFHVVAGVVPGDFFAHLAQNCFGNVLDPCKAVDDGFLISLFLATKAGAQTAVTHDHGRGAVADHFGQGGLYVNFQIEVGVDIQHAGQ